MSPRSALARLSPRARMDARYRELFNSPDGVPVLHDLLRQCGVLDVSHQPGDAQQTAFNDGRRSVALELLHRLRMGSADMIEMSQARMTQPNEMDELA